VTVRRDHPHVLAYRSERIVDGLDRPCADHEVEGAVGEGQALDVAEDSLARHVRGLGQHPLGGVEQRHARGRLECQGLSGDRAGAAAGVEHPHARPERGCQIVH
jgi:hypothetical protein